MKKNVGLRVVDLMEMEHQLFKFRALPLVIAATLFASQTGFKAYAYDVSDTDLNCASSVGRNPEACLSASNDHVAIVLASSQNTTAAASKEKTKASNPPKKRRRSNNSHRQQGTLGQSLSSSISKPINNTLDWVPFSQLPEEQRLKQSPYSCGAYIEPQRPGKDFKGDVDAEPITAEADSSSYDKDSSTIMEGNVRILQANRQVESDKVTFNKEQHLIKLEGNVRLREPGILVVGDKGEADLESGRMQIENASYVFHGSKRRGQAGFMIRHEDETIDLTDAAFTSCPPNDNGWLLSASSVNLNAETGVGQARHASLKFHGLPVLYTPYMRFPIDDRRHSGFLYPSFAVSSNNGEEYAVPYYINLAPNYDTTITARYMRKRGALFESETRYLTESNAGELGFAGIAGKDRLRENNRYHDKERWLVNWRHKTQFTTKWDFEVDYADASDKGYFDDFVSQLDLSSVGSLNQMVQTRYLGGDVDHDWQLSVKAHKYKNMSRLTSDAYNKLPQVELKGSWLLNDHLETSYVADYTQFSRRDEWNFLREEVDPDFDPTMGIKRSVYGQGFGIKQAEGGRLHLEQGVSLPLTWSYAFLTPEVKVRHVQYQLSNLTKTDVVSDLNRSYGNFTADDYTESPSTTGASFSIDSGLYFDRLTAIGSTPFTHSFEPRMKYLYSPHVKGQEMNPIFDTGASSLTYSSLWRDNSFNGYDRVADANQLAFGFTTRLMEEDGYERVRFGVGQIVYFADRKVYIDPTTGQKTYGDAKDWNENLTEGQKQLLNQLSTSSSPVASELVYNINRSMKIDQNVTWDGNKNQIDDYSLYYRYQPKEHKILNIGYRYGHRVERYLKDRDDLNIPVDPNDLSRGYKTAANHLSLSDVSFSWPVINNWALLGRWQYDLTNERNLEMLSGVEYNSCCYQVRLLWRSWIDPSNTNIDHPKPKKGVYFQVVLMGLGDIFADTKVKTFLNDINGFTQREE